MAYAVSADQIDAVIQTTMDGGEVPTSTMDGGQVPDGGVGAGGRCMQRKSFSRETKLEVVSFHCENGKNLAKYKDNSACRGYYLPFGVPLASLPQLESMFPCK